MNILMILDNLSKDSGVSSIVINLFDHIDRRNCNIDFLIFNNNANSYSEYVQSKGSRVYCLPNPLSLKTIFKAKKELAQFFSEMNNRYDIVHLHSPSLVEFTLKISNAPIKIIHSHSSMSSPKPLKRFANSILQRNCTKYATHYFSCSSEAAEFLFGSNFCNTHHIELIKNAIDYEKFRFNESLSIEVRSSLSLQNKTVLAHISNFSQIKNVAFLIPVIKKVVDDRSDLLFLFIGDGPTKNDIENDIESYGLSHCCHFLGRCNNVSDLLNGIDGLLLPSLKEGLPVTVIEAQANGIPCFVSDTITKEADVGLVNYLPLNTDSWIQEINSFERLPNSIRLSNSVEFESSDFNIRKEASRVEQIYFELVRSI